MYERILNGWESGYFCRHNELFARIFEQYIGHATKFSNTILTARKYEKQAYSDDADYKKAAPMVKRLLQKMAEIANK